MAVASEMPSIQLFSIPSGELSGKLEGHTQRYLLIKSCHVWRCVFYDSHYLPLRVKGLAVSPAGNLLFSASSDGCVRVWSLAQPLVSVASCWQRI